MIQIKALNKKYGTLQALSCVDVEIEPGRITAVLGPNGAGKTTLIKSILGLVKPDSGVITVDSMRVNGESSYREMIGYMPQLARYPENLTVTEIVEMIRDIRKSATKSGGRSKSTRTEKPDSKSHTAGKEHSGVKLAARPETNGQNAAAQEPAHDGSPDLELWEQFGLDTEKDKAFRTLSGGNRQKVSAVLAFLFRPKVLFLDEPTTGLDPVSSSILKDKILAERDRGTTIILTSHIMSEVQELAEQVVYMLEGKIYFEQSVAGLLEETEQSTLERAIAVKLGRRPEVTAETGETS
jgi:Cu-processing system ATP-binding protein